MFAKLYNDTKHGQILVKLDQDDEGNPELRFFFEPEKFGVCSVAISATEDSTESWDNMEENFNTMDEEAATKIVDSVVSEFMS